MYFSDSIDGIITFCENEGQPHQSLLRIRDEIRAELKRSEADATGSYEERAGYEAALRWVLGEQVEDLLPLYIEQLRERGEHDAADRMIEASLPDQPDDELDQ